MITFYIIVYHGRTSYEILHWTIEAVLHNLPPERKSNTLVIICLTESKQVLYLPLFFFFFVNYIPHN